MIGTPPGVYRDLWVVWPWQWDMGKDQDTRKFWSQAGALNLSVGFARIQLLKFLLTLVLGV